MKTKRKTQLARLLAAAALAAAPLTMLSATPASATPAGCNHFIQDDGNGYAYCSGGTGEFRVSIGCKGWINLGYGFTQYGDWRSAGGGRASIAKCPVGSWRWGSYSTIYFR